MTVNLSLFAGAGAQFFDNNGAPLAGGLVYSYLAGTTTPAATYTSSTGSTAHSNPIVLNSAGRVATGEIWLTSNVEYKFILYTSANVLIASYDNIIGAITDANIDAAVAVLKAELANNSDPALGDALIGFRQSTSAGNVTGAVGRTVHQKLQESVSIKDFGAVGNGVTNDNTAVLAAEASGFEYIDLVGLDVLTTLDGSQITKNYYNGRLNFQNSINNNALIKNVAPVKQTEIDWVYTKSPIIDWAGKNILWLGTSIPAQGVTEGTSYPQLFAKTFECTVTNEAYPGSHASFDNTPNIAEVNVERALSMTEADRLAMVALYPTSSFTAAIAQTCDYKIRDNFIDAPFDCVFLDHNHNDRRNAFGTLATTPATITSITKGVQTTVNVSSHNFSVGQGASFQNIVGIPDLVYASGRISAISGTQLTIDVDSSGYTGSFVSGTIVSFDRMTIAGSFGFLINYIRWCANLYGNYDCKIVLCTSPSEWTSNNSPDCPYDVYSNGKFIEQVADYYGLAFFNIENKYEITEEFVDVYMTDGTHPATLQARKSLVAHWIAWANGGQQPIIAAQDFIPAGYDVNYTDQREALNSKWIGGFGTPKFITGANVPVLTEDFESGLGTWTTVGTAPTIVSSVEFGTDALLATSVTTVSSGTSYISKPITFSANTGELLQFDVLFPDVDLEPTIPVATAALCQYMISASFYFTVNAIIRQGLIQLRAAILPVIGGSQLTASFDIDVLPNQIYKLKVEHVKETADYKGTLIIYADIGDGNGFVEKNIITNISDITRTAITNVRLGIITNNSGKDFDVYFDNLVCSEFNVSSYVNRYTGTFTSADSKTVTVVNGIIVSAV